MKRRVAVASGLVMIGLFLGTAVAGGTNAAETLPADGAGGQAVEQNAPGSQSSVSETQIDTVTKRAEARRQRDDKMEVRTKNVLKNSNSTNGSDLFRSSK